MTPLGIMATTIIGHLIQNPSHRLLEGTLNALAAGTFLYIGIWHNSIKGKSIAKTSLMREGLLAQLSANTLGIICIVLPIYFIGL